MHTRRLRTRRKPPPTLTVTSTSSDGFLDAIACSASSDGFLDAIACSALRRRYRYALQCRWFLEHSLALQQHSLRHTGQDQSPCVRRSEETHVYLYFRDKAH